MDFPNSFIGKKTQPSSLDLAAALGDSLEAWKELTAWLTTKVISAKEWHSISPKYGWALRPKLKSRAILYRSPSAGCFRVSFILGDRAVAAASASALPNALLKEIADARCYAKGTGIRPRPYGQRSGSGPYARRDQAAELTRRPSARMRSSPKGSLTGSFHEISTPAASRNRAISAPVVINANHPAGATSRTAIATAFGILSTARNVTQLNTVRSVSARPLKTFASIPSTRTASRRNAAFLP